MSLSMLFLIFKEKNCTTPRVAAVGELVSASQRGYENDLVSLTA